MSFRQFTKLSALIGAANAAGGTYDYLTNNGEDWASLTDVGTNADGTAKVNECGESN